MERAYEVLALGQVHRGLASDSRVDLPDQRRGDVDYRYAPQIRGCGETRGVGECATADGDQRFPAIDVEPSQLAARLLDHVHALGTLSSRENDLFYRPASGGKCLSDCRSRRLPGLGLHEEDRPARPEAYQRRGHRRGRYPPTDLQPADGRVGAHHRYSRRGPIGKPVLQGLDDGRHV